MGRWSDHAKVYYCKLKLSLAVHDWRGNRDESNKIAGKADADIKSTDIVTGRHLKVFIKKLKDTQLRSTLQDQRVRSLKDLKHILKQHEEVWRSDDREAHPLKSHETKSDCAFGYRQRQKINNRAYNVNEEGIFENDDEQQTLFDHGYEGAHPKLSFGESVPDKDVDGLSGDIPDGNMMLRRQDVTSKVYRTRHCDNCGEGSQFTEFCWADMDCNRCHKKGHPAKYCKVDPCPFCYKFHGGECYGLKTLQGLKSLAMQGSLNYIPDHLLNQLLDGHADPGTKPLNH
ncbi:hypothetical protein PHMEG_00028397 [Phytophthora megakarya]|uniref:CCHC-type domain-containing protein n=1 Tax=Phytophthora megakarya TaxID=4795 RepID=A0A225V519_9STRA|nr:hypothetical protein PHMEG_00028397 [Phytophthora megakarya]